MKRIFTAVLAIAVLTGSIFWCLSASADGVSRFIGGFESSAKTASEEETDDTDSGLPTINEALKEGAGKKVEVSDDLSAYATANDGEFDFGNFRMIVLQREVPEKEFTELDSGYPNNYIDDFPDDFTGIDLGRPRIWLRGDIMAQIPEYFRAESLEDADVLVMAENEYVLGGTLSVTDYVNQDKTEPPEFETVEEMIEYAKAHQPTIKSITYYPKFDTYTELILYNTNMKSWTCYDYQLVPAKRFARNPEASDLWGTLEEYDAFITALKQEDADASAVFAQMEEAQIFPEEKIEHWKSCVAAGEIDTAIFSMERMYWEKAAELLAVDSDPEHQENLKLAIDAKNKDGLAAIVGLYDYSGFETPIETIKEQKLYFYPTDEEWMEKALEEFVAELNAA